jgi:adenylate cyclase
MSWHWSPAASTTWPAGLLLRSASARPSVACVSPQVATDFIEKYATAGRAAELGGTRREVVILFSDLRDFTPLSESLPPERLIEVLNGYFAEMVAAIHAHHGVVDKFIGDAVLAVFGLLGQPGPEDPAVSAVRAAQQMQRRLARYNEQLADPRHHPARGHWHPCRRGHRRLPGHPGPARVHGHRPQRQPGRPAGRQSPRTPALPAVQQAVADRVAKVLPIKPAGEVSLKGVTATMQVYTLPQAEV